MAILRAVNYRHSNRAALHATLEYVSNPKKLHDSSSSVSSFVKSTWVNRALLGTNRKIRTYKQYIISLETTWPKDIKTRVDFENNLLVVVKKCKVYFAKIGFISIGYVHCNTNHPHIHMILETASALTGKQYSESKKDLAAFKDYVSDLLEFLFSERILTDIRYMDEEDMLSEDESLDCDYPEYYEYDDFSDIPEWNIGTAERAYLREMVRIVPDHERLHGRVMVRLVPDSERQKGREMVTIVK